MRGCRVVHEELGCAGRRDDDSHSCAWQNLETRSLEDAEARGRELALQAKPLCKKLPTVRISGTLEMMLYDLGELARLEPRSLEPVLAHKRWFTDVIA